MINFRRVPGNINSLLISDKVSGNEDVGFFSARDFLLRSRVILATNMESTAVVSISNPLYHVSL